MADSEQNILRNMVDHLARDMNHLASDVEALKEDRPSWVTKAGGLVGLVAGVAGLVFGGFSLLLDISERVTDPTVEMVMPPEVQLVDVNRGEGPDAIRVYIHPAFVSSGRSLRSEVLKDLTLYVQRGKEEICTEFQVEALGHFINDPSGPGLIFEVDGGPAPLAVTRDEVQDSVLAFEPDDQTESQFFDETNYSMTLAAETVIAEEQIKGAIMVNDVVPDEVRRKGETTDEESKNRFVTYPVRVDETPDNCLTPGA